MSSRTGLADWLLTGSLLAGVAVPLWAAAGAEAASPLYAWDLYEKYRPNGSSVVEVPGSSTYPDPSTTPPGDPAGAPPPAVAPPSSSRPPQGVSDAERLLALLNAERARRGAAPLAMDPTLTQMASSKAAYMAANGYASHYVPGYTYPGLAENLTGAPNVSFAHALFLASPSHARTMLDPRYTAVGIGVAPARNGGVLVVELFR